MQRFKNTQFNSGLSRELALPTSLIQVGRNDVTNDVRRLIIQNDDSDKMLNIENLRNFFRSRGTLKAQKVSEETHRHLCVSFWSEGLEYG